MRPVECAREHEVLDALGCDGPVASWSEDLQAHAASCAVCRDLVTVASALLDEHQVASEFANPPASGMVWWRMQMRARQEAARAATRPITVVQGLALASGAAIVMLMLTAAAPTLLTWFGDLLAGREFSAFSGFHGLRLPDFQLSSLIPSTTFGLVLLVAAVSVLLIGPLAAYFALGDE